MTMDYLSQLPKQSLSAEDIAAENARFMSRVYMWMAIGVLLSAFTSFYVAADPDLVRMIVLNKIVFYGLLFAQLGAVIAFSAMVQKLSATMATGLYLFYCFLTGLTLSVIFIAYTRDSIVQVFGLTSFAFAGLSAFGFFTKRDLGPVGSFCMMGLWGMIGFGLLSLFFPSMMSSTASKVYGLVGVIVFSGLTAYDTQKIKATNIIGNEGTSEDHKEAVHGALTLYLDFINLFLSLLRVMGNRR